MHMNALQCYIAAEDWATAKRLAACLGEDAETAVSLKQRLLLQEKGDITGLLQAGHTDAALLLLADNNEWTKCLQVAAEKESPLFLQLLSRRVHVRSLFLLFLQESVHFSLDTNDCEREMCIAFPK